MTLIPRHLKDLREELLAQLNDNAIERKAIAVWPKTLDSGQRLALNQRRGDLALGEARVKELEDQIRVEVARYTDRKAAEGRAASRKAVRDAHAESAKLHADHEALETWRNESVAFFADRKRKGSTHSAIVETAVKRLTESDPAQSTRVLEPVVATLRGTDQGFFEALSQAIVDIGHAAQTGEEKSSKRLFARAAAEATKQLDARLPQIHAATDADLTEVINP